MPIIDTAVYVDGSRIPDPPTLDQTFEYVREHRGLGWIDVASPTPEELADIATEFDLHELLIEDAIAGHQRAKLEHYGDVTFTVLRPALYDDASETVSFSELHVVTGPDFVVTIRHGDEPDMDAVRARLEDRPDVLRIGPLAVLYALLDEVVDEYAPIAAGLQVDIDEIEDSLFDGGGVDLSRRIYTLAREVLAFQRATEPLNALLETLSDEAGHDGTNLELRRLLRDVLDHNIRITDRVGAFRAILENALTVHSAVVTQLQTETSLAQGEQVKKISGWAAILFGPTLVGTVYGMNFTNMPELHWTWGYPAAVALMGATSLALYLVFKAKRWL